MANSRRLPPCVASEPAERIADIVRRLMCGSGRTRRLSVAQGCTTTCAPGHVVSGPYVWRQLHPVRLRRAENRAVTVSGRNSLGDDRLVHCDFEMKTCREERRRKADLGIRNTTRNIRRPLIDDILAARTPSPWYYTLCNSLDPSCPPPPTANRHSTQPSHGTSSSCPLAAKHRLSYRHRPSRACTCKRTQRTT
jgi:hypothetical protein